jgi:hypothetical protein
MRSGLRVLICMVVLFPTSSAGAQPLPDGWSTADVGAVGAAGSGTGTETTFTVSGAGADVWGTADAFRYAYRQLAGDGSIVAQVTSVQPVADWTKVGVMMRESLTPGSRHAFAIVSANKGIAFQRRTSTSGSSTHTAGKAARAPYFVRLTRTGNAFTAAASPDGTTWTTIGSATIAMPPTIYVGLAVSSHVAGTLATGTFEDVTVTQNNPTPTTPTTQTLIFFRHGEKPAGGYGQITCQGLQRALALPNVLIARYGTPDYLFAPNPLPRITDPAGSFSYVRPLATIEPTAIRLGLPVNAQYGYSEITALQNELLSPSYVSSVVFVSWEHLKLRELVQNIMNAYGEGAAVPPWPAEDYDSLYIVRLTNTGGTITAQFQQDYQGLDGLPTTCP